MIMNELNAKQKIAIISLGFISVLILVAIIVLSFFVQPHNKYGNEIGISNYDKYVSNLPVNRRDAINSNLYNIVKLNSKSKNPSIQDATIRGDSVEYNYDEATNINSGSFIVDMKSVRQSYLISYRWSSDENNMYIGGYAAKIECLPLDKLIYGNFSCKDDFANSINAASRDPILDYLPYSTFNYTVVANNNSGKIELNVDMILNSSDTRDGQRDNSINKYKSQVVDWIKSIKFNPDDYSINYNINE
jgi:hypothetical protein